MLFSLYVLLLAEKRIENDHNGFTLPQKGMEK